MSGGMGVEPIGQEVGEIVPKLGRIYPLSDQRKQHIAKQVGTYKHCYDDEPPLEKELWHRKTVDMSNHYAYHNNMQEHNLPVGYYIQRGGRKIDNVRPVFKISEVEKLVHQFNQPLEPEQ